MANSNGLKGPQSAQEFLAEFENTKDAEIDLEEMLMKLKLSNVEKLALMNKKNQKELLEAAKKAQYAAIKELHQRKKDQYLEEIDEQAKAAATLEDEEFKRRYNKSIEQFKKEKAAKLKSFEDEEKEKKKIVDKNNAEALKERKKQNKEELEQAANDFSAALQKSGSRGKAIKELFSKHEVAEVDADGNETTRLQTTNEKVGEVLKGLTTALSDITKQLDQTIDEVASYQGKIDTRLQGSKNQTSSGLFGQSYWNKMSKNITGIAGVSPFIKQSALSAKVAEMVGQGIAFNVEQRATLAVLSEKIATTFNAADGTLLRLIRIQQQDTTAGRLGMESALTAFLNNMYETTEYMQGIATQVRSSINEAMSLMTGQNALSFEYQIQKWLGSLYSVGMSDSSVQGLAGVLGNIAAGKLAGITSGGQSNLVIMAANQAGLSISDIMSNGLTANTTNQLMQSMVNYLAGLYEQAGDSKVIQQQIAEVYGMSASDLKAAVNLASSAVTVAKDGLTYAGAISRLTSMANTLQQRTSLGEMLSNGWDNFKYTMGASIANSPALYATYKIAGLLDGVAAGMPFSLPTVMGSGMAAQTFKVSDLMRVGALSTSIVKGLGQIISAGGGGGITGGGILNAIGVNNGIATVSRGNGSGLSTAGGMQVSSSGGIGADTGTGSVSEKYMTETQDDAGDKTASATDDTDTVDINTVDGHIVDIYNLIYSVIQGGQSVKAELTETGLINLRTMLFLG